MGFFQSKSADKEHEQAQCDLIVQLEDRVSGLEKLVAMLEKRIAMLEDDALAHTDATTSTGPSAEETSPIDAGRHVVNEKNDKELASVTSSFDEAEGLAPRSLAIQKFFLSAPTADGVFADSATSEQIGTSIYQLTTSDGINGSFILLDTRDAIATAMISVSQFVKPICKVIGNTQVPPRHVITEEEGIAKMEEGKWKVTRKAVVRFM